MASLCAAGTDLASWTNVAVNPAGERTCLVAHSAWKQVGAGPTLSSTRKWVLLGADVEAIRSRQSPGRQLRRSAFERLLPRSAFLSISLCRLLADFLAGWQSQRPADLWIRTKANLTAGVVC